MGLALSPFYVSPEFAFWDKNENERLDPDEVVYLNINPTDDVVSENDVRLTDFVNPPTTYHAGSQVSIGDFDLGRKLIKFGTAKNPGQSCGILIWTIKDPTALRTKYTSLLSQLKSHRETSGSPVFYHLHTFLDRELRLARTISVTKP